MNNGQTKLAGIAPGVLQAMVLHLHHTDYIRFAKTCGRFMRLLMDKRFMRLLMYKSLYFRYNLCYNDSLHTSTHLPNGSKYGYSNYWNSNNRNLWEFEQCAMHKDIIWGPTKNILINSEGGLNSIIYRSPQNGNCNYIRYYYICNKVTFAVCYIPNRYANRVMTNLQGVVGANIITEINNDGFDLYYLENIYNYNKYFEKIFKELYKI